MEGKTMSEISDETTALAVIPKNELARMAEKEGVKLAKLQKMEDGLIIWAMSGAAIGIAGAFLLPALPIIAPILIGAGLAAELGGMAPSLVIVSKKRKADKRQKKANELRTSRLADAARSALEGAIADDTVRAGLDICIAPQDESPKKLHIDGLTAFVDEKTENRLTVKAHLLEDNGEGVAWMNDFGRISLQRSVPRLPKSICGPSMIEALSAEITAEPPTPREPEKILPRIESPPSPGG
jgi:hypothetical protein